MTAGKKAKYIVTAMVLLVVVLIAARFIAMREATPAKSIEEIQVAEGIPVDVAVVAKGSISRYLELMGEVRGYDQVEITSSLPIDVTDVVKGEGENVKKGEVLVKLARDRTGNAYHQFAMAKQALDNAERDVKRMENLYKEGAVSKQMLEQARLGFKNAKSQYTQALSMVDLVTPIDGVITRVDAVEGQTAVPGMPLVTVASANRVRIRCFVGQDEVRLLKTGQKALIQLSSLKRRAGANADTRKVDGTVNKVSLSADADTKLFLTEIVAENSEGLLKPGLIASVSVLVQETKDIITIPKDALIKRESGDFVYLVKTGKALAVPVNVGINNDTHVAVTGDITPGDTLVVGGQFKLSDGARVRIHEYLSATGDEG